MPSFYSPEQRTLQDQFQTSPLADALIQAIVHTELQDVDRAFIESREFFFLATVDAAGQPSCSFKGGPPGFVRALSPTTLGIPLYDGNGMFLSAGNIQATAKVGLLFIDFTTPHRLRVQGSASLDRDDPLLSSFPRADLLARIHIEHIFVNCSRYIPKYERITPSRYVPPPGEEPPFATWKRIDLLQGVLPPRDQGKTDQAGGPISVDEYGAKLMAGEA